MITIKKADEAAREALSIAPEACAYIIYNGDTRLGFCEFELAAPVVTLLRAECEDRPLLDGVVRQSLSYALDHDCLTAHFSSSVRQVLLDLRIIKQNDETSLDILEFFTNINH